MHFFFQHCIMDEIQFCPMSGFFYCVWEKSGSLVELRNKLGIQKFRKVQDSRSSSLINSICICKVSWLWKLMICASSMSNRSRLHNMRRIWTLSSRSKLIPLNKLTPGHGTFGKNNLCMCVGWKNHLCRWKTRKAGNFLEN